MKPGLHEGHVESLTVTVTDEMCPQFEGKRIHDTLSTVSLLYHMEWVGRKAILPYLEPDEEGVGGEVSLRHVSPAPVGKRVTFYAQVKLVAARKVVCNVWAEHSKGVAGRGMFTQVILPRSDLERRIHEMM